MKKTEIKKLKDQTVAEFSKDLAASREEMRTLKFDFAAGKVKNVRPINELKKRIARILTFMQQKNGKQ